MSDIFDFGFTAVDDAELETIQKASSEASDTSKEVLVLEDRRPRRHCSLRPPHAALELAHPFAESINVNVKKQNKTFLSFYNV